MFFQPCLVTSQASSKATTHKIYLILLRRSKLSTKDKIVWKYCNLSQPQGRGSINPTLYNGGGRTLRVRPRVNPCFIHLRFINSRLINCWPVHHYWHWLHNNGAKNQVYLKYDFIGTETVISCFRTKWSPPLCSWQRMFHRLISCSDDGCPLWLRCSEG